MIGYFKCSDSNKTMLFKISDKKLFIKYTKISGRVSSLIGEEWESEPVCGDIDKYIKTKIKPYGDKVNTNFKGTKIPKEIASYKCFSLIM